jgi:hypothetical protein
MSPRIDLCFGVREDLFRFMTSVCHQQAFFVHVTTPHDQSPSVIRPKGGLESDDLLAGADQRFWLRKANAFRSKAKAQKGGRRKRCGDERDGVQVPRTTM